MRVYLEHCISTTHVAIEVANVNSPSDLLYLGWVHVTSERGWLRDDGAHERDQRLHPRWFLLCLEGCRSGWCADGHLNSWCGVLGEEGGEGGGREEEEGERREKKEKKRRRGEEEGEKEWEEGGNVKRRKREEGERKERSRERR